MESKLEEDLMNRIRQNIWGRDFELAVSYQNFPGENVTDNQTCALEKAQSTDFSESLSDVKQYIMKHYGSELGEDSIDNIFKYVLPKSILIPRNENKRVFAILCNFKFDMEHGLAIVFEDEKYKAVGPQDLIL